jgi:uncharacterized protein (DUF1800 family)
MNGDLLEPWEPGANGWDRAAVLHLYRRGGFGASPGEVEQALSDGLQPTLARLFEDHTSPELRDSIRPLLAAGELELLQAWWMALILEGGAPLRERMTLVWHGHFATSNDKVDDVRMMHAQNECFRRLGLGDFRVLLRAVARDPAMLRWLDGDSNRRGQPNENFARELMELFALGLGNFDEQDVREGARAFSGWGTFGRSFVSRPELHDEGVKSIFDRSGTWTGEDALDLVLEHPACARHVARRLLQAFVAPKVADEWVEALVHVLRGAGWDVGHTLRTLLASRLFFSAAARRSRIAGPVELAAVAARGLDAGIAPRCAARLAADMGQSLFRPPSVKGWEGGRAWIHSGHWIARHNALVAISAADGAGGSDTRLDLASLFRTTDREELAGRIQ